MKKRILILCLVLFALLSACGKQVQPTDIDPDRSWVDLKDGQMIVTLPLDQNTDYRWEVSVSDNSPITLSSQETVKGSQVYTFSATGDGDASISFACVNASTLVQIRNIQAACQGTQVVELVQKDTMDMNMPYAEG